MPPVSGLSIIPAEGWIEGPDNSFRCRTMLIGKKVEFRPRFDGTVVVRSLRIYEDLFLHEQRTCSGTVHSIQTLV